MIKYLLPLLAIAPLTGCAAFSKMDQAEDFISSYEEEKKAEADAALADGSLTLEEWRAILDEIERWATDERREAIEEGVEDIETEASLWWQLILGLLLGTGTAGGGVALMSARKKRSA